MAWLYAKTRSQPGVMYNLNSISMISPDKIKKQILLFDANVDANVIDFSKDYEGLDDSTVDQRLDAIIKRILVAPKGDDYSLKLHPDRFSDCGFSLLAQRVGR